VEKYTMLVMIPRVETMMSAIPDTVSLLPPTIPMRSMLPKQNMEGAKYLEQGRREGRG
jgi:hypothetical protein